MIQFVALFICAVSAVFLAVSAFAIIELWLGEDSKGKKAKLEVKKNKVSLNYK